MEQFIVFENNQQNFALDISKIERIIEYKQPKKIPESSEYLLGIIEYNDKILPIIDLTNRLYNIQSSHQEDAKIVVILWKSKQIGLVVDAILGIHSFSEEQYEQNNDSQISKEYIRGFIKSEEDITIVLDTDQIFKENQERELMLVGNN
ncbi:chemotaxis protein CheW [Alkalibaculum sp. M08DMB]|uniref:Chemotaxis protein CheW n=1 Tax=Alkalibaculum sporogenes TaxID=2655001 RepID=A0A6A7K5U8_9FIRM|nr:chemotaxis protein CheW [Alkalibaculum sporogenes]MPW24755.1 chemotaxis protein CheW [Alkalibaculum sporogenes]